MPKMAHGMVVALALVVAITAAFAGDEQEKQDDAGSTSPPPAAVTEYIEVNVSSLPRFNTIATRLPLSTRLTPLSIGAVSEPLIEQQGGEFLGDALRNVSGVNVQAGPAVADFFSVRGFDSLSSCLVLVDGAPDPEATFFDLYNVAGVEVLKGPAGFLYGRNPLAGAVNLIRKQPQDEPYATLGVAVGSFETHEGNLDWNFGGGDDFAFRLNGVWRESEGYRDGMDSEIAAFNPTMRWRIGETSTLNVGLEVGSADFTPDSGLPIANGDLPDVPRRRSYQTPLDFSEQDVARFQVDFENRQSERLTLRNKLYYRGLDWQSDGTLFNGVVFGQVLRTLTILDDEQEFVGNQFEAILGLAWGNVRHTLLAGVDLAREADEFTIDIVPPDGTPIEVAPGVFVPWPGIPTLDLVSPVETVTDAVLANSLPLSAGDYTTTVIAPYLIDQIAFSDRFQALVGMRYDDIEFEDDVQSVSRSDGELSPMAGVVFAPSTQFSVYANAGRSHAPVSPRVSSGVSLSDLEPEESTQLEVGTKHGFHGDRIRSTFALYSIDRENIAITDPNGVTQQIGDQESQGFEVEVAAEPTSRLRGFASYAWNDAELTSFSQVVPGLGVVVDRSGNRPPYAPEHLASVWVSGDLQGGFGLGGGVRYIGEQYFDADNAFEIDDAIVLDAMLSYEVEAWRLRLNVTNLTDEEYETGSFGSQSVVPADGTAAKVSFEYRF